MLSLVDLPEEIIIRIFSLLDDEPITLRNVARTSYLCRRLMIRARPRVRAKVISSLGASLCGIHTNGPVIVTVCKPHEVVFP